MEKINKIYKMCRLPANKKTANVSSVHDFSLPNKLISEMNDSSQPVSPQKKTEYGFVYFGDLT